MARHPYANSIVATYEIKVWNQTNAGAEVKKTRTVLRKFANGTASLGYEKRKFYGRGGEWMVGSSMALNHEDIEFIRDHANEILDTLTSDKDTLKRMTDSERLLENGKVELDGKIYDIDKFYPNK